MKYSVFSCDNFHSYCEDEIDEVDIFSTMEEAINKAKELIDKSLRWERNQCKNKNDPDELYDRFQDFGDSPIIRPDTIPSFVSSKYAKERCISICKELM